MAFKVIKRIAPNEISGPKSLQGAGNVATRNQGGRSLRFRVGTLAMVVLVVGCQSPNTDPEAITCDEYLEMPEADRHALVLTLGEKQNWADAADPLRGLSTIDTMCIDDHGGTRVTQVVFLANSAHPGANPNAQTSGTTAPPAGQPDPFSPDLAVESQQRSGTFPDGSAVTIHGTIGPVISGSDLSLFQAGVVNPLACINDPQRDAVLPVLGKGDNNNTGFAIPEFRMLLSFAGPRSHALGWADSFGCEPGSQAGSNSYVARTLDWSNLAAQDSAIVQGFLIIYDYFSPANQSGSSGSLGDEISFSFATSPGNDNYLAGDYAVPLVEYKP